MLGDRDAAVALAGHVSEALTTGPGSVPPEQAQRVAFDAVRAVLGRLAADRGLVVVLDDLQWADEATLRLLERLVDGPALLVGTAREEGLEPGRPLARTCERLLRRHAWREIRLRPLSQTETAKMLAALAGGWAPEAVACAVLGQAGGNPFFVEQLYRHLAEGGQGEVPGTVRLVLGHRFARLSDTARRLLDAVAVLGRDADLASAAAVAGLDEEAALEAVEAAEGVDLVEQAADGDVDRIVRVSTSAGWISATTTAVAACWQAASRGSSPGGHAMSPTAASTTSPLGPGGIGSTTGGTTLGPAEAERTSTAAIGTASTTIVSTVRRADRLHQPRGASSTATASRSAGPVGGTRRESRPEPDTRFVPTRPG